MATRYKLYPKDPKGNSMNSVQRITDDGQKCSIPTRHAEGNIDYQEYKAWVAAGNTPEAAD